MPSGEVTNDHNQMSNIFENAFALASVRDESPHPVLVGPVYQVMNDFYLSVEAVKYLAGAKVSV